jgi:hypothetical protein
MTVSVRSFLAAGLAAATVSAVVQIPVSTPRTDALTLSSDAVTWSSIELSSIESSAAIAPLLAPFTSATAAVDPGPVAAATGSAGEAIINTFNAVEPFVQYGFELAAWAAGYLPWPIGWLGQQINIAYNTGEPIVQALVYSFAYLIDGQFDLIGLTLSYGLNLAVTNFVEGEIAWLLSFLPPLPPLPPPPPFPTAAVASRAAAAAVATRVGSEPVAAGADTPMTEAPVDTAPTETSAVTEPVAETPAVTEPVAETPAPRATRAVARRAVAARQSPPAPAAVDTDPAALDATAVDAADATSAVSAPIATPVKEPRRAARSTAVRPGSSGTDTAGSSGTDTAGSSGTDTAGPVRSADTDA